jgi:3-oxoacyl-[acyl-carrier-protein] synthase II
VSPVTAFDVSKTRCSTAGQVAEEWLPEISSRKERRLHRASRMMIGAVRELGAQDSAFVPELAVIGTTSGGMDFGENYCRARGVKKRVPRAAWLANYEPQKMVLDALQAAEWSVPVQIIANACASGSNAIGHAFELIRGGLHRRILCGGYDAISEMVFVGFDTLQAATPGKIRPFDTERSGMVLGEGAALFALEKWEDAEARGVEILAEVTGYGISTDNHHLTQPHPSGIGPLQAMERALVSAGIEAAAVDYINAHGTATIFNDASEGAAISKLRPGARVSSSKSMMGHSLGAAGAIEAAYCVAALRAQFLPPNINFREKDPAWDFEVIGESRLARVDCVLSNSFGFGGANASIVLNKA